MRTGVINYMRRFSYPQVEFVKSIIPFLNKTGHTVLVDAPCGYGITSRRLGRLPGISVHGYDKSPEAIAYAKRFMTSRNVQFNISEMHDVVKNCPAFNYFCIINSLFLLPYPDKLLSDLSAKLTIDSTLFIIIPNTEGANFNWFQKHYPEVNKLILNPSDLNSYFESFGLVLQNIIPIVYCRSYGRKDINLLSALSPIYLRFLNTVQTAFRIGTPNYYTLRLKKLI